MVTKEVKQKAAESLVGKGINFSIEYKGRTHQFAINKLVLKSLIRISNEVSKLIKYNFKTNSAEVIVSSAENAAIMARCVAIAVINSKPAKKKPFFHFLPWKKESGIEYMNEEDLVNLFSVTLDSTQLMTLSNAIVAQMDTASFFAATISMGGIDLLEKTKMTDTDPLSPFGEE